MRMILASESPRRKELLSKLGIPFEVIPSNVDEESAGELPSPVELVKTLSALKAESVSISVDDCVIIAADTIVCLRGEIMGKPKDETAAFRMLKKLQNKQHNVYTGVTIIKKTVGEKIAVTFAESTKVTMGALSDSRIWDYIRTGEPFDKAGAYAIQGIGCFLVKSIDGDYNNVVGLPLFRLYAELEALSVV